MNLDRRDLLSQAANQRRLFLFRAMTESLGDRLSAEELDIHFTHMPARYWSRVNEKSVARHLELIHEFFTHLRQPGTDGTAPLVWWQHLPDRDITSVEIATWDRLGLLARAAGAFAAVGLNIVRADVYTRADHVALDLFEVCDSHGRYVREEIRLHQFTALLTESLRPGQPPPRLPDGPRPATGLPPRVEFAPDAGDAATVLMVEADDRLGLLHDILSVIADCQINVAHAIITTENHRAGDVFYLTDADGHELRDLERCENLRRALLTRLTAPAAPQRQPHSDST